MCALRIVYEQDFSLCKHVVCDYYYYLTPSLPSLYNVRDERCSDTHANSVVFAPITSTFNAVCFDENLSHASAEKKTETVQGFKCCTFTGRFQVTSWQ